MKILAILTCALVTFSGHAQSSTQIALCDVLRESGKYNGHQITVRATWKYGFEWSRLYCLDCRDMGSVWLETPIDLDPASQRVLKNAPKGAGTVNVTVTGVFESGSTYGHLNDYRYRVTAQKLSNLAVIVTGMKSLEVEGKAETKWACGGLHPR